MRPLSICYFTVGRIVLTPETLQTRPYWGPLFPLRRLFWQRVGGKAPKARSCYALPQSYKIKWAESRHQHDWSFIQRNVVKLRPKPCQGTMGTLFVRFFAGLSTRSDLINGWNSDVLMLPSIRSMHQFQFQLSMMMVAVRDIAFCSLEWLGWLGLSRHDGRDCGQWFYV